MGERDGGARPKPGKQLVTYKIQMCWAVSHENNNYKINFYIAVSLQVQSA